MAKKQAQERKRVRFEINARGGVDVHLEQILTGKKTKEQAKAAKDYFERRREAS
ncbi:hypothetical protein VCB98_04280 [Gammaproteobacteria bacterium AB-CW1]|uniref:Uncharacterized protein n=1 Tax=Natronospira elongata TaxID=3110268 RepID=A0AAP6ML02_9GAMM|nr:hypothetical protein [Gammaproteobacteria bacterium AB-CW1]